MLNYNYLATKSEIDSFNHNQLAKYRYLVLFEHGSFDISPNEFNLACTGLASFMREDCLIIQAGELNLSKEETPLKSVYHIFNDTPGEGAYIAIATILPDVSDALFLSPVYHGLKIDQEPVSRYPFYDAVNRCLKQLHSSLINQSISDFELPGRSPKELSLVSPDGPKIRTLRKQYGSLEEVAELDIDPQTGQNNFGASKNTLLKAEKGLPITSGKLRLIADYLKTDIEMLTVSYVQPSSKRLREARIETGLNKDQLAEEFGLKSGYFFELLESADRIPTETMRFVYHRYSKFPELKHLKYTDLILQESEKSRKGNVTGAEILQ